MIGELISAGAKLFGGLFDRNSAKENAERNIAAQKQFAQEGIRWKVADAKAAGIHPIYALGGSSPSFSPVSIGDGGMASALGGAGQDLSRAINSTRTQGEREDAFATTAKKLQLEGAGLDNDIKRATLASAVARLKQQVNPPFPGIVPGNVPSDDFGNQNRLSSGHEWLTDPTQSGAQEWEDRYGETISDWIMGPYTAWRDLLHNYPRIDAVVEGMKRPASFNDRFGTWRTKSAGKSKRSK